MATLPISKHKVPLHPDAPDAAMAMDLGYRFTAAINLVESTLESWHWLVDWCDEIRASMGKLVDSTVPKKRGEARTQFISKPVLDVFSDINQDSWVYKIQADDYAEDSAFREIFHVLWQLNKKIYRAIEASPDRRQERSGLLNFWLLGERLALNDLNAFRPFKKIDHETFSIPMAKKRPAEFANLDIPNDPVWESTSISADWLLDYILREDHPSYSASAFKQGGCVCFLKAVLCPSAFNSALWAYPALKNDDWVVMAAGRHFSGTTVVYLPSERKQFRKSRLINLILAMMMNKAGGLPPSECGWVLRDPLLETSERSTASKAWDVLCKVAAPIGGLEYISTRSPKETPHRGYCRLPGHCASDDCDLIVEGETEKL